MVANFVNLADNKFTLNGIEYHKNYAPIQVNQSDSQVRVISAYDSRFALVPPTHYSEYTVNGFTYTSVESLIRALVDVVFSKFTLDGVAKEFQDSVLQYMDDVQSDVDFFKGQVNTEISGVKTDVNNFKGDVNTTVNNFQTSVNNDLNQIEAEKQVFESEAQEIKDSVANMSTTGKIYDSLAEAIAESPKPADGTPFSVMGDGDNDGYYKFDSTQPDGVKFGRKFDRRIQVESISLLRNYKGRPGEAVDVLGYYEEGDDGGGLFYWDAASTEADNGGTIIQATGITTGRWKRRSEELSPDTYGGDIQKAINEVAYKGNIIKSGRDNYVTSQTILLNEESNIDFRSTSITQANGANLPSIVRIFQTESVRAKSIDLDLIVDGNMDNNTEPVIGFDITKSKKMKSKFTLATTRCTIGTKISGNTEYAKFDIFSGYDETALLVSTIGTTSPDELMIDLVAAGSKGNIIKFEGTTKSSSLVNVVAEGSADWGIVQEQGWNNINGIIRSVGKLRGGGLDIKGGAISGNLEVVAGGDQNNQVGASFKNCNIKNFNLALSGSFHDGVHILSGVGGVLNLDIGTLPVNNGLILGSSAEKATTVKINANYLSGYSHSLVLENCTNCTIDSQKLEGDIYISNVSLGNTIYISRQHFRINIINDRTTHDNTVYYRGAYSLSQLSEIPNKFKGMYVESVRDFGNAPAIWDGDKWVSLLTENPYELGGIYQIGDNVRKVVNPEGGMKRISNSEVTGSIKIKIPGNPPYIKFKVDLYSYTPNERGVTLNISGFSYNQNWVREQALIEGGFEETDYPVRFGTDEDGICIWIGDLNHTWSRVFVSISNVVVAGGTTGTFRDGWDITLVDAFDTIISTSDNNFPFSDWNKIKNKPIGATGSYTSQDGKSVTVENGIITSITDPAP